MPGAGVGTGAAWEKIRSRSRLKKKSRAGVAKKFSGSQPCIYYTLVVVRSQEGSQFVRGFGGIGGMLRYTVDFQSMQLDDLDGEDYDLDDY